MRVVAGIAGGRRLKSPGSSRTRPTTDRVREAIFNSLVSLEVLEGTTIADLFAGTGACGIEALSRGAAEVFFVDADRKATRLIEANLRELGLAEGATVITSDVFAFLETRQHVDVVIADPPYDFDRWADLLASIDAELVVCESNRVIEQPLRWRTVRERKHGETYVTLLSRP